MTDCAILPVVFALGAAWVICLAALFILNMLMEAKGEKR